MGQPVLSAIINADGRGFTKTLGELQQQLKRFQEGMKSAGNTESFQRLQRAATETQRRIDALKNIGNPLKPVMGGANEATQSLVNLGRVVQDAPYGFIGIANNLNPLIEGFGRTSKAAGGFGGALKAMGKQLAGAGGIGLLVSVASSALVLFGDNLFKANKEADKAAEAVKRLKEATDGIFQSAGKEAAETASLIALLKSETETRERKLQALQELKKIQPEIFGQLKLEGNTVSGLDSAYKAYLTNLRTVIAVKIRQAQLEAKITELLQKQGATLTQSEKDLIEGGKRLRQSLVQPGGVGTDINFGIKDAIEKETKDAAAIEKRLQGDIDAILKDITELSKGIELPGAGKGKDRLDELIGRAKELADFFNKTTIRDIRFDTDPTLSKAANANRAKDFIAQVLDPLRRTEFRVKPEINVAPDFKLDTQAIELFQSRSQAPLEVTQTYDQVKKSFEDNINRLAAANPLVLLVSANVSISQGFDKQAQEFAKTISEILSRTASDALSGFGEILGNALAGGDITSGFQNLANVIGNMLQSIGKEMIATSALVQALKAALKSLDPKGLLIAGIGLVAVGAALKASINKSFGGFRAAGGPVGAGRSYVVGERGPEIFVPNTGGSIIPNNRIGTGTMAAVNQQLVMLDGRFTINGNDLVLLLSQVQRSQGRLT